ncbi:MAG TPA: heavy metal-binding domain-containing protein [Actinospica sp.]|nr:heavy metal-binding domain-containing protein [Actinospica sp.]
MPDPRLTRLDRLRDSPAWSFEGPIGGLGAATVAGFDPVGQVFGTTVAYLGPPGLGHCFVPGTGSGRRAALTSADPYNPLLEKLVAARVLALDRAVAECQALGGDGIIGMRLSVANFFTNTVEFTVEGTAVRARSTTRPHTPFTTHVSGQDLVTLLRSGWVPFSLVFGMAIAACHFDDTMFQQTRRGVGAAANREVSGYTRIVNDARRQARRTLEHAVRERGGEGAVLHDTTLHLSERECPLTEQRTDYLAEATILGSAIIPLERSAQAPQPSPLTIMRLDHRPENKAAPEPEPNTIPTPSLGDRAFAYWSTRRLKP